MSKEPLWESADMLSQQTDQPLSKYKAFATWSIKIS